MEYQCSQNAEVFYQSTSDDLNILNLSCKIRTRKRSKYYRFSYDPISIQKQILDIYGKDGLESMFYMFDFEKRTNCCYCVAITVYFTEKDKEYFEEESSLTNVTMEDQNKYEYRYLLSILQTVTNAKMFLPDWLVRIYMDKSIYQVLKKKQNTNLCKIFDEIFESENVEIFTFDCNVKNIEQTRTYRFLPMIDPTVAKVAVREADGYLCKMDCNNIRQFSSSNAVMYLAEYFHNSSCNINQQSNLVLQPLYDKYNDWIGIYKEAVEPYFDNATNLYSLVAGTITLNLMVKYDYFSIQFQNVFEMIQEMKSSGEYEEKYYEKMDIGFDEVFLLHMFRDFISISLDYDEREYIMLTKFVIGSLSYPTYSVSGNSIDQSLKNLSELVYQGYLEEVPMIDPNENEIDFLKIVDSVVSLDTGKIFNVAFVDLEVLNPFGDQIYPSLLALLNIQYIYAENKITCVAESKVLNYRKKNSPKDKCWSGDSLTQMLFDVSLYDQVYMEEKNYMDRYYSRGMGIKEKRKRST